jgi:hypothetical protein
VFARRITRLMPYLKDRSASLFESVEYFLSLNIILYSVGNSVFRGYLNICYVKWRLWSLPIHVFILLKVLLRHEAFL